MSQAEVSYEGNPLLPQALIDQVSQQDQERWLNLQTAFLPYRFAGPPLIRHLIDEAFDMPHATAQKLRQEPVLGVRTEYGALTAALKARNSALHVRVPMFEELAVRLDADRNYNARRKQLNHDPDPVYLRRLQTAALANVVEISVGLDRPTPYTRLNGLSG